MSTDASLPFEIEPYGDDDAIVAATRADGTARVSVYPYRGTAIVLGRGSDPLKELRVEAVAADGVAVRRRRGGGCAVVLDPGNVIVTAMIPLPGLDEIRPTFERCTAWLIDGLTSLGIAGVGTDGVSDLVVGDRKVAGSCVHRSLGLFMFSASLLVAPDVEQMTRYLSHPPREPGYRLGRAHVDFVTSLADHWDRETAPDGSQGGDAAAGRAVTAVAFADRLRGVLEVSARGAIL